MPIWVAVSLGGALGATCRWLLGVGLEWAGPFPWGTLAANVIGCALIGFLAPVVSGRTAWLTGFTVTGFLGGFTTYSAFAEETFVLLDRGDVAGIALAIVYVLVTVVAAAAAVALGSRLVAARMAGESP